MKNLVLRTLLLVAAGIFMVSCQEEPALENLATVNNRSNNNAVRDLTDGLIELNTYLNDSEVRSKNTFLNYWESNPNSTLQDLENADFISESTMLSMFNNIELAGSSIDDDLVWQIISDNMDERFIDNGSGPVIHERICIFCCTGCLDGIKGNNCFESLFWEWGKGC